MPVAWHPARWWDWCMPEGEKKGIEPSFTDKSQQTIKSGEKWWEKLAEVLKAL